MIPAGRYQVHPGPSQQRISRAQRRKKNTLVIELQSWREPAVYLQLRGEGHSGGLEVTHTHTDLTHT